MLRENAKKGVVAVDIWFSQQRQVLPYLLKKISEKGTNALVPSAFKVDELHLTLYCLCICCLVLAETSVCIDMILFPSNSETVRTAS